MLVFIQITFQLTFALSSNFAMKKFYSILVASVFGTALIAQPVGWLYSQHLTVTNTMSVPVYNYQLQLTIDTQTPIAATQMQASGADILFGKNCPGSQLVNFWIQSGINTTTTIIWVKIDTLPANGSTDLFMYYGNSSAISASAIPGVFIGPHSSTDSVASGGAGGVAGSQRGFRFAPTQDILMSHAGKREPTGTTRYVTLFDFTTQAIITQQQVGGPAAQYSYNPLPSPLWLTSGTQYVLELFQGTGDGYYFGTSSQIGQHLTYLDMRYCNGCTQNTFPTQTLSNYHYGYPDMWYWTKQTIASVPTVVVAPAVGALATTNSGAAALCINDSVSVSVTTTGGIAPYTYNWLPSAGVGSPTSASTMISPSVTTTYTCTTFDACGTGVLDSVTITVNMSPSVIAMVSSDSLCIGASFTPSGMGAVTYVWSDSLTDGTPYAPAATDTYSVIGTDSWGCSSMDSVTVTVLPLPTVVATALPSTLCLGGTSIISGSGASSYAWSGGANDGDTLSPTSTITYVVFGTDMNGCQNSDSVTIVVNNNPTVSLTAPSFACDIDGAFTLVGNPAGGTFSGPGVTSNMFDPATAGVGTHTLMYSYTDSLGCSGMDTSSVTVDLCLTVVSSGNLGMANVFPNPFENSLTIQLKETTNAKLVIMNNLGQVVLSQKITNAQTTISTEQFATGVYFLEVQTATATQTIKIVKNK